MKRLFLSAAALAAFAAQPALAQDIGLNLTGHVAPVCGTDAAASSTLNLNSIGFIGPSMVGADGHLVPYMTASGLQQLSIAGAHVWANPGFPPTIWCNGTASTVMLSITPLTGSNPSTNPTHFTNRIDLAVEDLAVIGVGFGVMNFSSTSLSTVGGGASVSATSSPVGQFAGYLHNGQIAFSTPTGVRPVAGDYTGSITITFIPN